MEHIEFKLDFYEIDFAHPSEMQYLKDNIERLKADITRKILEECQEETTWSDDYE